MRRSTYLHVKGQHSCGLVEFGGRSRYTGRMMGYRRYRDKVDAKTPANYNRSWLVLYGANLICNYIN